MKTVSADCATLVLPAMLRVNDTKYDLCVCGHERQFHKFQLGSDSRSGSISAAVQAEMKRICKECGCDRFELLKDEQL